MLDDPASRELEFGFNFHLCPFQRIVVTSERVPFDAIGIRRMWTIKVNAVKIGGMAFIVPPGSFVRLWATASILVIVVIFRRKLHTTKRKMTDCLYVISWTAHLSICEIHTKIQGDQHTNTNKETNKETKKQINKQSNHQRGSSKAILIVSTRSIIWTSALTWNSTRFFVLTGHKLNLTRALIGWFKHGKVAMANSECRSVSNS